MVQVLGFWVSHRTQLRVNAQLAPPTPRGLWVAAHHVTSDPRTTSFRAHCK